MSPEEVGHRSRPLMFHVTALEDNYKFWIPWSRSQSHWIVWERVSGHNIMDEEELLIHGIGKAFSHQLPEWQPFDVQLRLMQFEILGMTRTALPWADKRRSLPMQAVTVCHLGFEWTEVLLDRFFCGVSLVGELHRRFVCHLFGVDSITPLPSLHSSSSLVWNIRGTPTQNKAKKPLFSRNTTSQQRPWGAPSKTRKNCLW